VEVMLRAPSPLSVEVAGSVVPVACSLRNINKNNLRYMLIIYPIAWDLLQKVLNHTHNCNVIHRDMGYNITKQIIMKTTSGCIRCQSIDMKMLLKNPLKLKVCK